MSREISLATYWGWHFHRVLTDLRLALDPEIQSLAKELNCTAPKKLELFRRSWIGLPSNFLFRWSFFNAQSETSSGLKALMQDWQTSDLAKSFMGRVSELKTEFPIGTNIANLNSKFFNGSTALTEDAIEDWRALYLQTPTRGTILQHLWEAPKRSDCRTAGFLVAPEARNNRPTDFPPFHFQSILPKSKDQAKESRRQLRPLGQEEEWEYIAHQEEIRILSQQPEWNHRSSQDAGSQFFQEHLYKWFYSEDERGTDPFIKSEPTTKFIRKLNIKYFVFVPIYLGRSIESRQWLGVLQIRFLHKKSGASAPPLKPLNRFREQIIHLSEIVQILANDLMVAHVQESFNRPFPGVEGQRKLRQMHLDGCQNILNVDSKSVACRSTWRQLEQLSEAEYQRLRMKVAIGRDLAREFIKNRLLLEELVEFRERTLGSLNEAFTSRNATLAAVTAMSAADYVKFLLRLLSELRLQEIINSREAIGPQTVDELLGMPRSEIMCGVTLLQIDQLLQAEAFRERDRLQNGREQARHFFGHENLLEELDELRGVLEAIQKNAQAGIWGPTDEQLQSLQTVATSVVSRVTDLRSSEWRPGELVSLGEVIQSVLEQLSHLLHTLSLESRVIVKPKGLTAKVDASKFKTVLYNIIRNALNAIVGEYGHRIGGQLIISARRQNGNLLVSIRDNGRTLTKREVNQLWTDPPGIGLFLTKEYIEAAGGKIALRPTDTRGFKTTLINVPCTLN